MTEPIRFKFFAVTGHPGTVFNNRSLFANHSVEKCALANVRTPDNHRDWKLNF
jgi:hypothetical protein